VQLSVGTVHWPLTSVIGAWRDRTT